MQADFKNMVKEIFGYERIRDIPEEELMHLTKTYGYSPLLQFLHSRYLKEKNDRHYPTSVARTAIYFSNPHWLHHQLQKNHLDWIEDPEVERNYVQAEDEPSAAIIPASLPEEELAATEVTEIHESSDQDNQAEEEEIPLSEDESFAEDVIADSSNDPDTEVIPEEIPEETAVKAEDIYANTLLDDSAIADEMEKDAADTTESGEMAVSEETTSDNFTLQEQYSDSSKAIPEQTLEPGIETEQVYPEFDTIDEVTPLLDADTGFEQHSEESAVASESVQPEIEAPAETNESGEQLPDFQEVEKEGDANDTDGEETEKDQPAPGFRPISLPVMNEKETRLSFEPLYVVDYFASQGVKLTQEEESRDQLTRKLKSFTEWLKSMKRIHPEKLSHELDDKTELTIKTVAEHSNEKGEILTETMAEIFMKQGLVDKSMEVYEKLSLLYPSKSDYFAAKISALKAIGT